MARFVLFIFTVLMATAPLVHGYFAYKTNAVQTLPTEEETHDEKPDGKQKKDCKESFLHTITYHQQLAEDHLKAAHLDELIILSKGFAGTPLMPPEVI